MEEDYRDDYHCNDCDRDCDGWESAYCCRLCEYYGGRDCDKCDPMDI